MDHILPFLHSSGSATQPHHDPPPPPPQNRTLRQQTGRPTPSLSTPRAHTGTHLAVPVTVPLLLVIALVFLHVPKLREAGEQHLLLMGILGHP